MQPCVGVPHGEGLDRVLCEVRDDPAALLVADGVHVDVLHVDEAHKGSQGIEIEVQLVLEDRRPTLEVLLRLEGHPGEEPVPDLLVEQPDVILVLDVLLPCASPEVLGCRPEGPVHVGHEGHMIQLVRGHMILRILLQPRCRGRARDGLEVPEALDSMRHLPGILRRR
eukprot:694907-Heterocapsa_arctica.AAC.1